MLINENQAYSCFFVPETGSFYYSHTSHLRDHLSSVLMCVVLVDCHNEGLVINFTFFCVRSPVWVRLCVSRWPWWSSTDYKLYIIAHSLLQTSHFKVVWVRACLLRWLAYAVYILRLNDYSPVWMSLCVGRLPRYTTRCIFYDRSPVWMNYCVKSKSKID